MKTSEKIDAMKATPMKITKEYKTITQIAGPLVFVEKTEPIGYGTLVKV